MDWTQAFWHILNFFSIPLGVAFLSSVLAKGLGYPALRKAPFWGMWLCTGVLAVLAWVLGLWLFEREGTMLSYGLLMLACSTGLVWAAHRPGRG